MVRKLWEFGLHRSYRLEVRTPDGVITVDTPGYSGFVDNRDGTYTHRFAYQGPRHVFADRDIKSSIDRGPA